MKPKSNAILLNLPEEQQAQLVEWLLGGMPYHRAQAMLEKEYGVTVSMGTFTGFWEKVCVPELLRRRSQAVTTANEVADEARKMPGRFDAATIDALKQKAFELAISPNANPKDVKSIMSLVLKARGQDLDARQLSLDQERFKRETCELFLKWSADQRAKEIAGGQASNADKIEQLGQLMFGEEWS